MQNCKSNFHNFNRSDKKNEEAFNFRVPIKEKSNKELTKFTDEIMWVNKNCYIFVLREKLGSYLPLGSTNFLL